MKIALVCPYAWDRPGGVQSHIRSLAPALARRGHDVSVVAPVAGRTEVGTSGEDYSLHLAGRTVPVPANGSVAPIAFGPRAASKVETILRSLAPDVVQAHEPLIPSLSLLAVRRAPAPVVGTFHAATDSSLGYRLAAPVLSKVADRIAIRTAVSPAARALARRYFPGDYEIVPNGIDVDRFGEAQPLDFGTKKTVLFLGRVEKRKGLEVLVQAVARLGDLDARLVVVGDGPRLRASRGLAARLGIDAAWLGRVSEDDVPRAYRGASLYCAPNLGGESFGIVLLEAMAAGAPVVCSDLPAFREVAGEVATVCPAGDVGSLAAALRSVLVDGPDEGRVEAGRERAAEFAWGALAGRLEAVFERAAAGERAA